MCGMHVGAMLRRLMGDGGDRAVAGLQQQCMYAWGSQSCGCHAWRQLVDCCVLVMAHPVCVLPSVCRPVQQWHACTQYAMLRL
jgi:hypothetical protein